MSSSAEFSQLEQAVDQIIAVICMVNKKSRPEYLAMALSEFLAEMKTFMEQLNKIKGAR